MAASTFDHERLDVYRLSIDYVAFSYQIARTFSGVNRPARDQWLRVCAAIDDVSNSRGKSDLKRIVSMLTRLIQRTQAVSEKSIEYEYRDAEYEYEYEYEYEPNAET